MSAKINSDVVRSLADHCATSPRRNMWDNAFAAQLETTAKSQSRSPAALVDAIAIDFAKRFLADDLTFEVADCGINRLAGYAFQHCSRDEIWFEIYLAFDAGEIGSADANGAHPWDKHTRPKLLQALKRMSDR